MIGPAIFLLVAAAVFAEHATLGTVPSWLAAAAQLLLAIAVFTGKWTRRSRAALGLGVLATVAVVFNQPGLPVHMIGLVAAAGCHAALYGSLLIWFTSSLRLGREPVITGFARRVRRTMPDKVMRYTRQVTVAWCLFFATQIILSAALLLLAPEEIWSAFVNFLNMPLLLVMILGEFSVRQIVFRHEPRTSLIDTLSAIRHARPMSPRQQ